MAISDTEKLDFLWKKVIWGTSKTAGSAVKGGSNETVPSPLPVYSTNIWAETDAGSIPPTVPSSTTSTVQLYTGASRIRATSDPTAPSNQTWFATTTYNTIASRVGDFIPTTFGSGYLVKVWIGDPNSGNAARIFPDTTNEEYVFDYNSGVLNFTGTIPSGKAATVGTGTFSVASNGIYFEVFRYIGLKGTSASKSSVVADIAARNALTPAAGDRVHVIDASGIPTDAKAGEYADYVYDGTQWVLTGTQDSARSDSLTTKVVVTAASTGTISLGYVGNGARVVEVSVEVTDDFDGDMAISVGDAGDNIRLMGSDQNDLQGTGSYVTTPIYQFPAGTETEIAIYVTGTATVGSANVIITYA
jgi:hypothetical protein